MQNTFYRCMACGRALCVRPECAIEGAPDVRVLALVAAPITDIGIIIYVIRILSVTQATMAMMRRGGPQLNVRGDALMM